MRWAGGVGLLVFGTGCALGDGSGFATVSSAALEASFAPGAARDLGDGAFLTNGGARVRLETLEVELGEVELSAVVAGGGGTFDPANPPAGYGTCHSGHCHRDDGALIPYEEIQAELAGGAATYRAIVRFPLEKTVDLLAGEVIALEAIEPSRELPETTLARATLHLHALMVVGEVEGGARFETELPLETTLSAVLSEVLDRDGKAELNVRVKLALDAALFDDVDLSNLDGIEERLAAASLEVSL